VKSGPTLTATPAPDRAGVQDGMVAKTHEVQVARVYEPPSGGAARVLVDRLWPRGLTKETAALDGWCKRVAPSNELRHWYGHDPQRFDAFTARYVDELREPERAEAFDVLRALCGRRDVTLLTATTTPDISHAAVLARLLADGG
jgi:uncharacterized protein YeaO (DUF488 family)